MKHRHDVLRPERLDGEHRRLEVVARLLVLRNERAPVARVRHDRVVGLDDRPRDVLPVDRVEDVAGIGEHLEHVALVERVRVVVAAHQKLGPRVGHALHPPRGVHGHVGVVFCRRHREKARGRREGRPREDAVVPRRDVGRQEQRRVVRVREAVRTRACVAVPGAPRTRVDLVLERVELVEADGVVRLHVVRAGLDDAARPRIADGGVLIELRPFERIDPREGDGLDLPCGHRHRLGRRERAPGDRHRHRDRLRVRDRHGEVELLVDRVQRDGRPVVAADVAVAPLGIGAGRRDR